ncbi:MAG TPA: tetratricopeptide repeat protein [Pirellulales bacterium]|nr:tetratricopeptide repeat protein [Pirellulales bacterium]
MPHHPEAIELVRRSAALLNAGDRGAAAEMLREALAIEPRVAAWHCDLAVLDQTAGRIEQAEAEYRRAVECDSSLRPAWYNLGCLLNEQDREAEGLECFQQAVRLDSNQAAAHHNLAQSLFNLGHTDEAIAHYRRAAALGGGTKPETMLALSIAVSPTATPREVFETRRAWSRRHLPRADRSPIAVGASGADSPNLCGSSLAVSRVALAAAPPSAESPGRPLRLGYVSAYFDYPNWMKPVWPVINSHDRRQFELFLYSDGRNESLPPGYEPNPADRVHFTASLDNAVLANLIASHGIDVLVDLNGFSRLQRLPLFAFRPAALNVGWFNMFATTGMEAFDYLIGDHTVLAPGDEADYCEKLVRLDGCYLAFAVEYAVPPVVPLPCLAGRPFTFGSLASLYKLTPQVVALWSRVLEQSPGSRLLLRNQGLRSAGNRRHLAARFIRHGIAADRLELLGPTDHFQFLQTYDAIDLALDPWPYNGGTTTSEALWQGVPVASIRGDRWTSRVSASLLTAAGLSEFIASDVESLVRLASAAAKDPGRLAGLRGELREQLRRSPACDTNGLTRQLEFAYRRMRLEAKPND